ncbi:MULTISPECIES: glycosyltransferase family 4 protein [Rhodopirellula]|uniref:glycosyltransferase family 4 protein n=1 Tax=Rhodopirellula TaxID=265488 RepID=UPI00257B6405|nr:glycosyltransferase family 1 protein [Rhodopirellula sp. UBA1907]
MHVSCYIQPIRTFVPTTGAGKHINSTILELNKLDDVTCNLLCSSQWLVDGKLPEVCLLRDFPTCSFPFKERHAEWLWKLLQRPQLDRWAKGADWIYSAADALLPAKDIPVAITVYDIHPLDPLFPVDDQRSRNQQAKRWKFWVPRAIERSDVVFTISEFSKSRMVELLGAPPEKIVVVGCGVESSFFDIATVDPTELNVRAPLPYVIVVGGLGFRKAGDVVLDVARQLTRIGSPLTIVVAGNNEPQYLDEAKSLPNLELLGKVSDDELPSLVRGASSLLMLSRYEGFGIPPAEAMAAGVPVVVSATTSLPEVVGEAGIQVALDRPSNAAESLELLRVDSKLRENRIQAGRIRADSLRWENVAARIHDRFQR